MLLAAFDHQPAVLTLQQMSQAGGRVAAMGSAGKLGVEQVHVHQVSIQDDMLSELVVGSILACCWCFDASHSSLTGSRPVDWLQGPAVPNLVPPVTNSWPLVLTECFPLSPLQPGTNPWQRTTRAC